MKKRYETPLCEVCEMEMQDGLLVVSGKDTLKVDNIASDIAIQGDVNGNNGWDLW